MAERIWKTRGRDFSNVVDRITVEEGDDPQHLVKEAFMYLFRRTDVSLADREISVLLASFDGVGFTLSLSVGEDLSETVPSIAKGRKAVA
jgi:hypothetical protein